MACSCLLAFQWWIFHRLFRLLLLSPHLLPALNYIYYGFFQSNLPASVLLMVQNKSLIVKFENIFLVFNFVEHGNYCLKFLTPPTPEFWLFLYGALIWLYKTCCSPYYLLSAISLPLFCSSRRNFLSRNPEKCIHSNAHKILFTLKGLKKT